MPEAGGTRQVDLHTHSSFSDGELSPQQLLEEAQWAGLSAIAITDHDNVDGLIPARECGKTIGIEVISGVELSCEHLGLETHILGLLIEPDANMLQELQQMRANRENRMQLMLDKLRDIGIKLSINDLPRAPGLSLGRPHLARLLVKRGIVRNIGEAFERYIGDNGPAFVHKQRWTVEDGIKLIHQAKGISFLAHPGASGLVDRLDEFIGFGLDGIEVFYPKHSPSEERFLKEYCQKKELLMCGGSDYHSSGTGPNLGMPFISYDVLESIRQRKVELWPVS